MPTDTKPVFWQFFRWTLEVARFCCMVYDFLSDLVAFVAGSQKRTAFYMGNLYSFIGSKEEIQNALCSSGLLQAIRLSRSQAFRGFYSLQDALRQVLGADFWRVGARACVSQARKRKRTKAKTADIVLGGCSAFFTFTFTDECLRSTTPQTRRRYVARFLRRYCSCYVANIDYSPEKDREHYHAIASLKDFKGGAPLEKWKHGFMSATRIKCHNTDLTRVTRYITKFTNHALKLGEKAPRLIYSRDKSAV